MSISASISDLKSKTIVKITGQDGSDQLYFICSDGSEYLMNHEQDCCECVYIDDIVGNLDDLLNSPVLTAYEADSGDVSKKPNSEDSFTWTFYRIETINGGVTIKWYGSSNGYYSESVKFERTK